MRKTIVGVMGPGETASPQLCETAYELGQCIAQQGWILLTGGRNVGVMNAASCGAKAADGLTIGILPTSDRQGVSDAVDIAICTGLGSARNNINVQSSDVVVACGMGAGTASEVALAIKAKKPVILLSADEQTQVFFQTLANSTIVSAASPTLAIALIQDILEVV